MSTYRIEPTENITAAAPACDFRSQNQAVAVGSHIVLFYSLEMGHFGGENEVLMPNWAWWLVGPEYAPVQHLH